jgi:hypothetical protein
MRSEPGGASAHVLPSRLFPALAFGAAHLCLIAAAVLLVAAPDALSQFYHQPRTVAIVHLVTLGWIGLSIAGALPIIGPIALRTTLPARRGDLAALAAIVIGATGVGAHAWIESWPGLAESGLMLLGGFAWIGYRLIPGLLRSPVQGAVKLHVVLAFLNLFAAGGLGIALAMHQHRPYLAAGALPWVHAHLHAAAFGWVAMLIAGTGYRLLPMILPAAMPKGRDLHFSAVALQAAALLLPAGFAARRPGVVWAGAAAATIALLAFLAQAVRMLREPRRPPRALRRPDFGTLHAGAAILCACACAPLGILARAGIPPGGADRLAAAYGVLLILGFLAQMVAGVGARIVPLYAAARANRGACNDRPPISPQALQSRPIQGAAFALWILAILFLTIGALAGAAGTVRAGALALLAAALLAAINLVRALRAAAGPAAAVVRAPATVPRDLPRVVLASLGLALLVAGCSHAAPPRPAVPPDGGTARMAQRIEEINRSMDPLKNRFMNQERVKILIDSVARAKDDQRRTALRFRQADELLKIGSAAQSIAILQELIGSGRYTRGSQEDIQARALLATAYYRVGIQENCAARPNPDRCILPIEPQAVHTESRGTRAAFNEFLGLLADQPADTGWIWLLNVTAMSLGEWPDRVPVQWRIPPRTFDSEHDIGRFRNVAGQTGIDVFNHAGGGILEDFDGDGLLDLMVSSMGLRDPLRLFINRGDGTFVDRSKEAGLEGLVGGLNCSHADYDNDGDFDVLVLRGGWMLEGGRYPNSLLRNDGRGRFEDITEWAGLLRLHPTQVGAWGDYDNDGFLDLFVGNESLPEDPHPSELWRNNGDGTFTDRSVELSPADLGYIKGAAWGDFNNDGRQDLYVSYKGGDNYLFRNDGKRLLRGPKGEEWWFVDVAGEAGVTDPQNSFPTWFWDFDNDGWLDIWVGGYMPTSPADAALVYLNKQTRTDRPRLYRNKGNGTFTDVSTSTRLDRVILPMGSNFGDLDNDGWLDAYFGVGQPNLDVVIPNRLFRNDGGRTFQDVTTAAHVGHLQKGHGVAFGDVDNDGDQDIFEQMGGFYDADVAQNVLYENPGHDHHWITLRLEGRRSNRAAVGARIRVAIATPGGPRTIHLVVDSGGSFGGNSLQQEIGLADATAIDAIEVFWPVTGRTQVFRGVERDRVHRIVEGDDTIHPVEPRSFRFPASKPPAPHH